MEKKYPMLFSPIKLGNVLVQNRIVANPMSAHFDDRCLGGAGIVICGHTIVEPGRSSWMAPDEPYLFSKYTREEARCRALKARSSGAAASIELSHAGLYARTTDYAMGPDSFTREDGVEVRAMTPEMMEHTARCWAQACVDARRSGFDMVFLHFGHGWLAGQFLSPLFNHRVDSYGGSIENRMRFPLQILRECRRAVGPFFPMEMRISADEWMPGGIALDDVIEFCVHAQKYVTSIQVSCGLDIEREANVHTSATNLDPHLLNRGLAKAIKERVDVPITLVGSVGTPEEAEEAIASGACDMVAMARALAADPFWPKKARDGRGGDIVPCLRCLQCYHISTDRWDVACSVNPRFGHEGFVPLGLEKAEVKKRVLVVGAGPAGCKAALTAVERGHDVVLAEASDRVGGMLNLISKEAYKQDVARYLRYLTRAVDAEVRRGSIDLRLGWSVNAEEIKRMMPDAVIIAVGALAFTPSVPGIENRIVIGYADAIMHPESVGKNVVLVGGGTIGVELGIELAESGDRRVWIIEMSNEIASTANELYKIALRQKIDSLGDRLEIMTCTSCCEVTNEGAVIRHADGAESLLRCDTVIVAAGVQPNTQLAESLFGIVPESYLVGDCKVPRVIKDATFEGYIVAANL